MFSKCKEYAITLNLDKCAFMVCSRTILRCIMSKEGKILDLIKIGFCQNASAQNTSRDSSLQWNGLVLQMLHQEFCFCYGTNHQVTQKS
jgi:hypothetical protein